MKIIIKGAEDVMILNAFSFNYVGAFPIRWKLGRLCSRFEEFPDRHEGGL